MNTVNKGIKTSELWLAILGIATTALDVPTTGLLSTVGIVGSYILSRTVLKR